VNRTQLQRRPDGTMFIVPAALLSSLNSPDANIVSQPGTSKAVLPQSANNADIEVGQYLSTVERDVLLITEAAYMDIATPESSASNTVYRCFRVGDAELQRLALGVHGPSLLPGRFSDEKYWKTANLSEKELPLQAAHPREWEGADMELHVTHAKPLGAFRDLIYVSRRLSRCLHTSLAVHLSHYSLLSAEIRPSRKLVHSRKKGNAVGGTSTGFRTMCTISAGAKTAQ
jgi:hypothetical protein